MLLVSALTCVAGCALKREESMCSNSLSDTHTHTEVMHQAMHNLVDA